MKRIDNVELEGEKIGFEKYVGKDNQMIVNLHLLRGFDSLKISVKDTNLIKTLEEYPNRKPIKIKVNISTFKDNMYIQAIGIVA